MVCKHGKLEAGAHKFAKAGLKQHLIDEASAAAALRQTASTEMVRASAAVDMIDTAHRLSKTSKHCAEFERLVAAQAKPKNNHHAKL